MKQAPLRPQNSENSTRFISQLRIPPNPKGASGQATVQKIQKVTNPTITPSGRKVTAGERREKKTLLIVDTFGGQH